MLVVYDKARKFLLEHDLPLRPSLDDMLSICCSLTARARVMSYVQGQKVLHDMEAEEYAAKLDAFTIIFQGEPIIFYADELGLDEKIYVLAHEIAHIVLGHTYCGILGYSDDPNTEARQEAEANTFALYILAPPTVLQRCQAHTANDIRQLTGLSEGHSYRAEKLVSDYAPGQKDGDLVKKYKAPIRHSTWRKHRGMAAILAVVAAAGIMIGSGVATLSGPAPALPPDTSSSAVSSAPVSTAQPSPTPRVIAAVPTPQPVATPTPAVPQSDAVYVTSSGSKYHRADCYHIRDKRVTEMTIDDAEAEGYGACKTCRPNS